MMQETLILLFGHLLRCGDSISQTMELHNHITSDADPPAANMEKMVRSLMCALICANKESFTYFDACWTSTRPFVVILRLWVRMASMNLSFTMRTPFSNSLIKMLPKNASQGKMKNLEIFNQWMIRRWSQQLSGMLVQSN